MSEGKHSVREVTAEDGTRLHTELWEPEGEARFVVCLVHGGAEHVSRYEQVARELNAKGAVVFGLDHRGQGRSGGHPGHVERFEQYSDDLFTVLKDYAQELGDARAPGNLPWFLWGHSMGGLISLLYLIDHEHDVALRGAVISAPLLGLAMKVGPIKDMAVRVLAKLLPRLAVPTGIPPEAISRDPKVVERYIADGDRVDTITPAWALAMEAATERVAAEVRGVDLPMHWYVGTGDRICDHEATQEVFASLPDPSGKDQSLEIWPGYAHELHNEPAELRQPVIDKVHAWLEEHRG